MSQANNDKWQGVQASIPVSKLRVYSKTVGNPENIADIAESIRGYGILAPLIVIGPDESGIYDIMDGDGRYQAICMINDEDGAQTIQQVPCYVVCDGKDDLLVANIIEQLKLVVKDDTRREARRLETVKSIYDQCERGEIDKKDITLKIQSALGVSGRYARMYKLIHTSAIPELQEAVKCVTSRTEQKQQLAKGKESVRVHIERLPASKLALYSEVEQEEMLHRVYKGENVKDVLAQAQKIRDSKKS